MDKTGYFGPLGKYFSQCLHRFCLRQIYAARGLTVRADASSEWYSSPVRFVDQRLTKRLRDKIDTDACQMSGDFGFHISTIIFLLPEGASYPLGQRTRAVSI